MKRRPTPRYATNLSGTFELYGLTFRWSGPRSLSRGPNGVIPLVRESRPLALEQVQWLQRGTPAVPWFGLVGDDYAYRFDGQADFLLPRDGSRLRAYVHPGARPEEVHFALARGVLPRLLHLRGITCLHASAVRVGRNVVGFLGRSGMGKSTVAASLVACGHLLVSDDVLPVFQAADGTGVVCGPGLAEFRLGRHSAYLAGVAQHLSPCPRPNKWLWIPDADQCHAAAAPLSCLYHLRPRRGGPRSGHAVRFVRLTPIRALFTLVQNSFWLRSSETPLFIHDFACLAHVVRAIPIYNIYYRLNQAGLAAVERLIQRTN